MILELFTCEHEHEHFSIEKQNFLIRILQYLKFAWFDAKDRLNYILLLKKNLIAFINQHPTLMSKLGRDVLLHDCDGFTREYFRKVHDKLLEPLDLGEEVKKKREKEIPPYTGKLSAAMASFYKNKIWDFGLIWAHLPILCMSKKTSNSINQRSNSEKQSPIKIKSYWKLIYQWNSKSFTTKFWVVWRPLMLQ